jgi:hypothetical protein
MSNTTKIRQHLPHRYSRTIQDRIVRKGGKKYALNYIAMCLSDPPLRHNDDILNEAANWARELQLQKKQTKKILNCL